MKLTNAKMAVMSRGPVLVEPLTLGAFTDHYSDTTGVIILIFSLITAIVGIITVCLQKELPPLQVEIKETGTSSWCDCCGTK